MTNSIGLCSRKYVKYKRKCEIFSFLPLYLPVYEEAHSAELLCKFLGLVTIFLLVLVCVGCAND